MYQLQGYGYASSSALGILISSIIRILAILATLYKYIPSPDTYHNHINSKYIASS